MACSRRLWTIFCPVCNFLEVPDALGVQHAENLAACWAKRPHPMTASGFALTMLSTLARPMEPTPMAPMQPAHAAESPDAGDATAVGQPEPAGLSAEGYNQAVQAHADGLFRYVLGQCRNEADARDAVQNAFEALWRKREGVHPGKVKPWLYRTAYRDMIDGIRKQRRMDLVESLEDSFGDVVAGDTGEGYTGLGETLRKALEALPDTQRAVVQLRDYEGYSYLEIGEITGLTESQVKVYIYRARKRLQQLLGSIEAHC